jgi:hypothetical protein
MNSIQLIITAIISILAVGVGATLQYYFSRSSEERKYQQNLRTQAYVDFLRYVGLLNKAQEYRDINKQQEFGSLLTETRMRISAYGNRKVIEAILNFIRKGGKTETPEGFNAFVNIIQAMRKDCLGHDQNITDTMICEMVFSPEICKRFELVTNITNVEVKSRHSMAKTESITELHKDKLIGQTTSSFFGFSFCLYGFKVLSSKILAGSVALSDKVSLGLCIFLGSILLICAFIFGIISRRSSTPGWARQLGWVLWLALFVTTLGSIMLTMFQVIELQSFFPWIQPLFYVVYAFFILYLILANPWGDVRTGFQKLFRIRRN